MVAPSLSRDHQADMHPKWRFVPATGRCRHHVIATVLGKREQQSSGLCGRTGQAASAPAPETWIARPRAGPSPKSGDFSSSTFPCAIYGGSVLIDPSALSGTAHAWLREFP